MDEDRKKIAPLKFWCQKILPMTFDDSLSYYEVLCRTRNKLNEVVNAMNNYTDELKSYVEELSAENLATMQKQFDELQAKVDQELTGIRNEMDQLTGQLDDTMNDFRDEIAEQIQDQQAWVEQQIANQEAYINETVHKVYSALNDTLTEAKAYTDFRLEQFQEEFPELTTVYVRNPVTGFVTTLQEAIYDMYDALRYMALTAFQYDTLDMTAQDYDDRTIPAWFYDRYAIVFFWRLFPWWYAFSGNSGKKITLRAATQELWANDRTNGLTAQAFDGLEQTAQQFDAADKTAYAFDWQTA